jgi:hypothetical protein
VDYKLFIAWVTIILERLTKWMRKLLEEIKDFIHQLWNWMRANVGDIVNKVQCFLEYLKSQFDSVEIYLFEVSAQEMYQLYTSLQSVKCS